LSSIVSLFKPCLAALYAKFGKSFSRQCSKPFDGRWRAVKGRFCGSCIKALPYFYQSPFANQQKKGAAYPIDPAKPCKGHGDNCLWIITEADRSATTFLLPDEY